MTVGGIVGSAFKDVSGSAISKCYVTGTIVGNGGVIGGIAGSIFGANITHCYSAAAVSSGDNIVGGIAGRLINNGNVSHCYSTGAVSGNDMVGGIAGKIIASDEGAGTISNCAALNPSITATGTFFLFGRVAGLNQDLLSNNVAFNGMLNPDGTTEWEAKGLDMVNGADITAEEIYTDSTLGGRFLAADGWTVQNGKLPGLFGTTVDMPPHLNSTTGIAAIEAKALQIYPNPASDVLHFSIEAAYEITDLQGRILLKSDKAAQSVNINSLPSGTYFVILTAETGKTVKKIIKK
jgi:hypothetical protein